MNGPRQCCLPEDFGDCPSGLHLPADSFQEVASASTSAEYAASAAVAVADAEEDLEEAADTDAAL